MWCKGKEKKRRGQNWGGGKDGEIDKREYRRLERFSLRERDKRVKEEAETDTKAKDGE